MALALLIRERQEDILDAWEGIVRSLDSARRLSRPALRDQVGEYLEWLAERLEKGEVGAAFPQEYVVHHAHERVAEGYDLSEVISEYAVLRDCLHEAWEREPERLENPIEIRLMNQALDDVIAFTAVYYARTRLFQQQPVEEPRPATH
jgi:RsbT co-antagonist protein rsbRD N-terminal domain